MYTFSLSGNTGEFILEAIFSNLGFDTHNSYWILLWFFLIYGTHFLELYLELNQKHYFQSNYSIRFCIVELTETRD